MDSWHPLLSRGGRNNNWFLILMGKYQCLKRVGDVGLLLRYILKCDHYMRCQLNQELLYSQRIARDKSLIHNKDSMELHFNFIVSNPSILAVQGRSAFGPKGLLQGVSSNFTWD